jgi:4-hydroxy-L-threonine phosphate dehydrogenase PdxA
MNSKSGERHTQARKPIIATMIGDPAGIGPEVVIKALATGQPQRGSRPLLIGSVEAVIRAIGYARADLKPNRIDRIDQARFEAGTIDVLDPGTLGADEFRTGEASAASGRAVRSWLDLATRLAQEREVDGWIMAPIDRTSLKLGVGMTDDEEAGPPGTFLLRLNGNLRIVALSEHIAIRDVSATVTKERLLELIALLHASFERWGVHSPRIALAGLNPHARGEEEANAIRPAIEAARQSGVHASGPVSPDTVFRQCLEGKHDVVVSMYHDQGQIALKTSAFEGACSVYLGLPYVHLTVPHGSALDIAGKGIAQHHSMLSAMNTAAALAAGCYSIDAVRS